MDRKKPLAWMLSLVALGLVPGVACQSSGAGQGPQSPSTAVAKAPPAPKPLLPATRERAGAPDCALDSPSEIATGGGDSPSAMGMGAKVVFGPAGGLVTWAGGEKQGKARPLAGDGHPTGPERAFPVEKSFFSQGLLAFEGGFALVLGHFDVKPLGTRYFVQVFSPAGEARGAPVQLALGEHFFEGMSGASAGRFVVLGGPNQARALQSARAIVVHIDASGAVRQEVKPLAITAPVATRPAVAFALSPEHWALTVQVASGPDEQPFVLGGKTMERVAITAPGDAGNSGTLGGIEALIVDGEMHAIRGEGESAGTQVGLFSTTNRYQIRWAGKGLAVRWSVRDSAGQRGMRRGHLALDGQLRPEAGTEEALQRVFEDEISVDFVSGGGEGTELTRVTGLGERVGNPTRLDGALPDVDKGMLDLDIAWGGDRFVIAHEVAVAGARVLRTVGLRCGGAPVAVRPGAAPLLR